MNTIKIKVDKIVTEWVEIQLPIYKKTNAHFYKVISETRCIAVLGHYVDLRNESRASIDICSSELAFRIESVDCTEEEFNEAFNIAVGALTKIAGL